MSPPNTPPTHALRRRLAPLLTPLFRAWWRVSRGLTLGVRGLVEDADGRVLLVRHTYVEGWFFPGGGVERGETALDALARELEEEAGVALSGPAELLGVYSNNPAHPNDHVLFYRIREWRPCAPSQHGEIAEHGFFARDALPAGITKATKARLDELSGAVEHSHFWAPV